MRVSNPTLCSSSINVEGNGDKDSIEGDESLEFQDPQTTCRVGPSRHAMLLRWIRMEQLLDEIVGNRIHKQVLARAELLCIYLPLLVS